MSKDKNKSGFFDSDSISVFNYKADIIKNKHGVMRFTVKNR